MENKNITKKEKAIEIMKKMDIYKPYIKGFRIYVDLENVTKYVSLKCSEAFGSTKSLNSTQK